MKAFFGIIGAISLLMIGASLGSSESSQRSGNATVTGSSKATVTQETPIPTSAVTPLTTPTPVAAISSTETPKPIATPKLVTQSTPKAVATPAPTLTAAPPQSCDSNYSPCVPYVSYDLNCQDIGFRVRVIGTDRHRLDNDKDGIGCESY